MIEKGYKLSELEKDALQEVGYIGAGHAATALSKMTGKNVSISVPMASAVPLEEIPATLGGPEEVVTAVYLPITGDLDGSMLLIFPKKSALLLADLVIGKPLRTTKVLDEMDQSALKEVGNILSGNCLTALSHFLDVRLVEHIPDLATDMVRAVIDSVVIKFGHAGELALVLKVEFNVSAVAKIYGYFFLLFELEEAQVIISALRKKIKSLE